MPEYDDNQKTLIEESNAQYDSENTYRLNSTVRDLVAAIKKARAHYYEVFDSILGSTEELQTAFAPYKGHPWLEIDRAPAGPIGHFIAYANYKGITSHEIAEMLKNPDSDVAKATEQKLRDIKKGYFDMVAGTDIAEKIGSMVSYCENVKNDLPRIHSFIKDVDAMQENVYEILALGDVHSFLQQDYRSTPGEDNQFKENVDFFNDANEAVKGKIGVGMDDIYRSLYGVTLVTNRIKADVINSDGNLKGEKLFDAPSLFSTVYACDETRKAFENAKSLDEGIKAFSKNFIKTEENCNDIYGLYVGQPISAVDKKLLALCQSPSYEEGKGEDFLKQLNASKRPFGQLSDSSEFKDVKEKLNKFLEGKKQPLNTDRANLEELKASCEKYLKDHSPKSDEGKDRFKLINKVLRYADDNLVCMTSLTDSEAFREAAKKPAMEGLKKKVAYEGVPKDIERRMELVEKTRERHAASRGADEYIEKFLATIEDDYHTIWRAANKGEKLFDDPMGDNQDNAEKAFTRVQIYEIFRGEYQPETNQYVGRISSALRGGVVDVIEAKLRNSPFSKKFIDLEKKVNNLNKFLEMSPIKYLEDAAENTKFVKKKPQEPAKNVEKQVKPTEINPPTA